MESELKRLIQVYSAATASVIYSYYLLPRIPKHRPIARLFSILPVIVLFTLLPFTLHTLLLRGISSFFLLWLANFKLLVFAFHLGGPLVSDDQPISLLRFLTSALLPINLRITTTVTKSPPPLISLLMFAVKLTIFCSILVYFFKFDYKQILHPHLVLIVYRLFMYVAIEIVLVISALPVKFILGPRYELDPQFHDPYLSTSLQDFWSRRWNLMVPTILRPSVYLPLRRALNAIGLGRTTAAFGATFAAFAVSGLMHEIIWFCLTRVSPTWEVTGFFVLHGVCTAAETAVKRAVRGRIRLPAVVSTPLTLGFLAMSANWLFFPPLFRNGVDELVIGEYAQLARILLNKPMAIA